MTSSVPSRRNWQLPVENGKSSVDMVPTYVPLCLFSVKHKVLLSSALCGLNSRSDNRQSELDPRLPNGLLGYVARLV